MGLKDEFNRAQKSAEKNATKKCICGHNKGEHDWKFDVKINSDDMFGEGDGFAMSEKAGNCLVCSCPKFKTVRPWSKPKKFSPR